MDDEDCIIVSESNPSIAASLSEKSIKDRVPFSHVGKEPKRKRKNYKGNLKSKSSKVLRSDKCNDLNSPKPSKKKIMVEDTKAKKIDKEKLSKEKMPEEKENIDEVNVELHKKTNEVIDLSEASIEPAYCSGNKKSKSTRNIKSKNVIDSKAVDLPKKRKRGSKLSASPQNALQTPNPIFKMFQKIGEKKQKEETKCDILSANEDVMIIVNPEIKVKENVGISKCSLAEEIQTSNINNDSPTLKISDNTSNILSDTEAVVPVLAKIAASLQSLKTSASANDSLDPSNSKAIGIKAPAAKRKSMPMKRKLTPNQSIKSDVKKRKQDRVEKGKLENEEEIIPQEYEKCDSNLMKLDKELVLSSEHGEEKEIVEDNKINDDDISEIICEPDISAIDTPSSEINTADESGSKATLKNPKKRQRKGKKTESPENVMKSSVASNTIFKMFKKIEKKDEKSTDSVIISNDDKDILIVDKPEKDTNNEITKCTLLEVSKMSNISDNSISEKDSNSVVSALDSCTPVVDATTPISSRKKTVFSTPKTPANNFSIEGKDTTGSKAFNDGSPVVSNKTPTMKRKMTPMQIQRESEKKKKQEEREQIRLEKELQKLEKEKEKRQKEEERQKAKEEKQKLKLEEIEARKLKKDEERQKKEDERLKREEEKQKKEEEKLKRDEEKQKKDEEKQKKEEERIRKEEEKKFQEEEALEKKKKEKEKFAQFFVSKKVESPIVASQQVPTNLPGPFMKFQVKENMRMAPIVRENNFSLERKCFLDSFIQREAQDTNKNYLDILRDASYLIRKSYKTYPAQEKPLDNECEIVDDDDEEISGTDIMEESKDNFVTKTVKAKFLQFCENKRPAYYGSWSKRPTNVSGRNPFGKEKIFDYAYDSDEDWEEEETGESLSDSEGEAEGEDAGEENDQYEVDNDFFVPHGYLSDDEGKDDNDNEAEEEEETGFKDETMQKEQLKLKQAEFELEMKQKTKQLKPKVYGCIWMGDKNSHTAYDQLFKILSGHRSMLFFGSCPIDLKQKASHDETINNEDDDVDKSGKTNFAKSFPEKAVPDLIRLIHGNPHSKRHLIREFSEFWKNKCLQENSDQDCCIAMRKIEPKLQELGTYGRYSEDGVTNKCRTWYVSKSVREKYGLEDLEITNSWTYTIPPKVKVKEEKDNRMSVEMVDNDERVEKDIDDLPQSAKKSSAINLITRFTKVLNDEEKEELMKKSISHPDNNSLTTKTPNIDASSCNEVKSSIENLCKSNPPTTPTAGNKAKLKKKIQLISVPLNTLSPKSVIPKNSIVSFLQSKEKNKEKPEGDVVNAKESSDPVITLD